MAGYGWNEYDTRKGGRETIHDAGNSLDVTVDFVKVPGGQHGGNWAARVKGVPRKGASPDLSTSIFFYAGVEGVGRLSVENEPDPLGFESDVKLSGESIGLGDFSLDITSGPESNRHPYHTHPSYQAKPLDRSRVSSFPLPQEHLWKLRRSSLHSLFLFVSLRWTRC